MKRDRWLPTLPLIVTSIFLFVNRNLGWLPNDDGTLFQTALRVRAGELPHVDFHEPYTGALGYLNAAAIEYFGESMASLRLVFIPVVVLWMFSLYLIAARFLPRWAASVTVSALTLGSVFMHLSPVPSWHNLFLGTFALHAAIKYLETSKSHWMSSAGLLVGLSMAVKSSGAYFGLAVGILVVAVISPSLRRSVKWVAALLLALSILAVMALVASALTPARVMAFVLPTFLLVGFSIWNVRDGPSRAPLSELFDPLRQFAFGAIIPIGILLGLYTAAGHLPEMLRSALVVPASYIQELSGNVGSPFFVLSPIAVGLWVRLTSRPPTRFKFGAATIFVGLMLGGLVGAPIVIFLFGLSLLFYLPLVAGTSFVVSAYCVPIDFDHASDRALFAVTAGAVAFALIAFPVANQYYVNYSFPLACLAIVGAVFRVNPKAGRVLIGVVLVFSFLFAGGKLTGAWFADGKPGIPREYVELDVERLGLRIPSHYSFYGPLVQRLQSNAQSGASILAGPDSPEVYALTDLLNPTPVMFELISIAFSAEATAESYALAVEPEIYVLNTNPVNSEPSANLMKLLAETCREDLNYGNFTIFLCDSWEKTVSSVASIAATPA